MDPSVLIDPRLNQMMRPIHSHPRSSFASRTVSFDYGDNPDAEIVLHIPSMTSLKCASVDGSQKRRRSVGFTRTSMQFAPLDCDHSIKTEFLESTIKRVSSPTDFSESGKNPRDMLRTRMKSFQLTQADIAQHLPSFDSVETKSSPSTETDCETISSFGEKSIAPRLALLSIDSESTKAKSVLQNVSDGGKPRACTTHNTPTAEEVGIRVVKESQSQSTSPHNSTSANSHGSQPQDDMLHGSHHPSSSHGKVFNIRSAVASTRKSNSSESLALQLPPIVSPRMHAQSALLSPDHCHNHNQLQLGLSPEAGKHSPTEQCLPLSARQMTPRTQQQHAQQRSLSGTSTSSMASMASSSTTSTTVASYAKLASPRLVPASNTATLTASLSHTNLQSHAHAHPISPRVLPKL